MEQSADNRLTDNEITELTELFIKIYEDGAYDLEEGTKTPSQRKQVKHQFKKTLLKDSKTMSKYYSCVFRTVLEADIPKMSLLRRRIKEVQREKEQLVKNLEIKRQTMMSDVRKDIRNELEQGYFKEQSEQNTRLKKRVNEYNERIQQLNNMNEELKMDSENWVERTEYDSLQDQYYALLKSTKKKKVKAESDEDKELERQQKQKEKEKEKKRKRLEELEAEEHKREKEKADLIAELESDSDDEPEEINISLSSSDED